MPAPPPIRIPCEGALATGHEISYRAVMCVMCGHTFDGVPSSITPLHDRDDIISMLQRGDFGP
jgi:hypothetical protein